MTEFEMLKEALERLEHKTEITVWESLDESLIEDKTLDISYWFKGDKLDFIENAR